MNDRKASLPPCSFWLTGSLWLVHGVLGTEYNVVVCGGILN